MILVRVITLRHEELHSVKFEKTIQMEGGGLGVYDFHGMNLPTLIPKLHRESTIVRLDITKAVIFVILVGMFHHYK